MPTHATPGMVGDALTRPLAGGMHLGVEAPLRSAMFPQELGERIVWLSSHHALRAEIALNPPHLGPLEVRLSLGGGEAGAQFFSPHAPVREAIEAAMPRLREMLAEVGISLGQAQVRDEAFSHAWMPARDEVHPTRQPSGWDAPGVAADMAQGPYMGRAGLGLVDLYV